MEKEYVMKVAQIIKEQLVALTPMTVLMSWRAFESRETNPGGNWYIISHGGFLWTTIVFWT